MVATEFRRVEAFDSELLSDICNQLISLPVPITVFYRYIQNEIKFRAVDENMFHMERLGQTT